MAESITRIEDDDGRAAQGIRMSYFDQGKAMERESEIELVQIDAKKASDTEIRPIEESDMVVDHMTMEDKEMEDKRLQEYEEAEDEFRGVYPDGNRRLRSPEPEKEPALRDDEDYKATYDEAGNVTGMEVVPRPFVWQAADVMGDVLTGAIAGGMYSVDATAQFFVNTTNLFSPDPEDDIRFFSYLGDWLMKDGGDAKEFGRDMGRFMVPFLGSLKIARMATGAATKLKVFDKAPRFIAGAKGVKNLPKVNKSNIKKQKLQDFLKKDLTSGQLAYLLSGGVAYNADELSGGLAGLKALDGAMGGKIGEFFDSDDKTNAQKRLENALAERFLFYNIDKHVLPIVKQLGLSVHNWTSKPLAAKVASAIGMEKHILAQKQRVKLNARGQGNTVITEDAQTGLLKVNAREDGSIEFITQERMGHGFKQIIRSKEEMSDFALRMVPEGTVVKNGVIAIEHEGKLYSAKVGEKIGGRTIYTHLDLVEAHGAGATEIKAGTRTGFLDKEGKFVNSPASMPRQRYETLPELQGDEFIAGTGNTRLEKLKSMWDDGSLQERMDTAPTLVEKVSVANDIIEVLERSSKGSGGSKSVKQMRSEADTILKNMWGEDLDGLLGRAMGSPVNDPIAIAYATAARSAHDDLILALQRVENMPVGFQDAASTTSNMFRTLYNYAGLREQLKDVKKVWGRTGTALRFSQNKFDDILESPSFAKIMQESENASEQDTIRLAIALSTALREQGGRGLAKAVESFGKTGFSAAFQEGYIGLGLLSSPALQMLNLATGLANISNTLISRPIAGVASKLTGHGDVLMEEAMAGVYGMVSSIFVATKLGIAAAVTGKSAPAFTGAKMENYTGLRHITSENFGLENYTAGLAVDFIGKSARLTGRMLLGGDDFVKVVSYETERHMLSYRIAMNKMKGEKFDYNKFTKLTQEIYDNPEKYTISKGGPTIHQRGLEQGRLNVLQQDLGGLGKKVQSMQNSIPFVSPIVKLFVPFVKVLSNIPKLAVRYSPMSALNFKGANSIYRKSAPERMEEIGRMAYGTMLASMGAVLYNSGMLTDSGDLDWDIRRNRIEGDAAPPLSIRHVNDKGGKYWVDLSKLQPWINILGIGADAAKMYDDWDDKTTEEHIFKGVYSMKQMLANTSWMPNMHKLLDLMANDKLEPWKFQHAANALITSMSTPAIIRQIGKQYEPTQPEYKTFHSEPENKFTGRPEDYSGIAARMLGSTTGKEGVLPPHRNYNGDVVNYHETEKAANAGVTPFGLPRWATTGAMSFMAVREDRSTKVDKELAKIELPIIKPTDIVKQPQTQIPIRMRYYEYDYFMKRIGKIKLGGLTQQEAWHRKMNQTMYQEAPIRGYDKSIPSKQDEMMRIHIDYKTAAKQETIARFKIYDRAGRILDEPVVPFAPESRRLRDKRGNQ